MNNLSWKKVAEGEYTAANCTFDFSIQKQTKNQWVLDIFLSSEANPEQAHIDSQEYQSLEDAQAAAQEYK